MYSKGKKMKAHDLWYRFKCKFFHPYNVVKIKTLPCTWSDRDHILVHSCFQILEDFVKKERIDEIIDWNSDSDHKEARSKMDELLNWFHNIYLKFDEFEGLEFDKIDWEDRFYPKEPGSNFVEMKPSSENDRKCYEIVWAREEQMRKDLNEKLKDLVDIKDYLWT